MSFPFVDAHFHLWDLHRLRYPWLEGPFPEPSIQSPRTIASTYLIGDYLSEVRSWDLAGCVHVEAGAEPEAAANESDWLGEVFSKYRMPNGIVARVSLVDRDLESKLSKQVEKINVKGVRHLINWHPIKPGSAYPEDLSANDQWRQGYGLLKKFGLTFDCHVLPPQLNNIASLAQRHPETPIILNHLGLPFVTDAAEMDLWRKGIRSLAKLPHAFVKLSGAGFTARPFNPEAFRDVILEVIDVFGTERVLVATNFPTDRMFASLNETLGAYSEILAAFSNDEQRSMWGANANRFYRLGISLDQ